MIDSIAIFAGGRGERLRGYESSPKPFIDINGKLLVRRVIDQLLTLVNTRRVILLTCAESYNSKELLCHNFPGVDLYISQEPVMSGKLGAMRYLFDQFEDVEICLFANADTLFLNPEILRLDSKESAKKGIPTVFLANADKTRADFRKVRLVNNGAITIFQNTGVFIGSRDWFDHIWRNKWNSVMCPDLDDILLSNNGNSEFVVINTDIIDIGTPDRVRIARQSII
jgi:NDP-sugar pyrophosphorylase family protein